MFGLFGKKKESTTPAPKTKAPKSKKTEKEIATENGKIYFKVLSFDFDEENPTDGSFELDWNVYAVNKLREMGYPGQTDEDVVDNYFTYVCRNIALETYEKEMGDPNNRIVERNDLGDGRAEYK